MFYYFSHYSRFAVFFCTLTSLDLLFEPNISVCILVAIGGRYGTLCRIPIYVCMCLKVSVKNGQLVRVFVFCLKKMWVKKFKDSKGLAVFDLWLKLWNLWTVKKLYNIIWKSLFCNFNKKEDVFLLKQMVKNLQKHLKKIVFFDY